ncbi:MAG: ThuA domain-containing protein [Pseudohongiellaceae bacterium]
MRTLSIRTLATISLCFILLSNLGTQETLAQETLAEEPRRLLLLSHAGLYKHASLDEMEAAVIALSEQGGYEVTTLEGYRYEREELDFSMITREYLAQFDGIMMMTNGNLPMTTEQRALLVEFVENGGGFVGAHCASLTFYDYPPFGEMLGGYFQEPVAQERLFVLNVEDNSHPATRMLGPSWPLVDEFYRFGTGVWSQDAPLENIDSLFDNPILLPFSRDRVNVLLSLDTTSDNFDPSGTPLVRGGDYPQAWYQHFGEGRSFYTSIGHREDIWLYDPVFRAHIQGAIRWSLGLEEIGTP